MLFNEFDKVNCTIVPMQDSTYDVQLTVFKDGKESTGYTHGADLLSNFMDCIKQVYMQKAVSDIQKDFIVTEKIKVNKDKEKVKFLPQDTWEKVYQDVLKKIDKPKVYETEIAPKKYPGVSYLAAELLGMPELCGHSDRVTETILQIWLDGKKKVDWNGFYKQLSEHEADLGVDKILEWYGK